jgi:hypothetical protein
MAIPRVFVSSTCYDLGEIRDGLVSFINSYSYEPILSERGDIFYHPDLHTHESCVKEMENCQLFILVIGGRFGGQYVADRKKSVVNAEYRAARECGIPVYCFVKSQVLEDHRLYEKNKEKKTIVKEINFPSIEQQEYAQDIFEFINEVKNSPVNNGVFEFDYGRDIQEILRKQWAGMMYDFLLKRKQRNELEVTTALLGNLTLASKKTEEILENIYIHLDKEKAEESISKIDTEIEAKRFFQELFKILNIDGFNKTSIEELLSFDTKVPWYEFVGKSKDFRIDKGVTSSHEKVDILFSNLSNHGMFINQPKNEKVNERDNKFDQLFQSFRQLNKEQKRKVLSDFLKP